MSRRYGFRYPGRWSVRLAALLAASGTALAAQDPVGRWEFDDPLDLPGAAVGLPLKLMGTHQAVAGPAAQDGAVRIGTGSYYECRHQLPPNGSGSRVNRDSLLIDFRIDSLGPWYCFFQTEPSNQNDGDCFVRANDGAIGVGQTGYSTAPARPGAWQRLLVTVDNEHGVYRLYLDGERLLEGSPQALDGRFALSPTGPRRPGAPMANTCSAGPGRTWPPSFKAASTTTPSGPNGSNGDG